jgi:hypothetical protein
LRVSVPSQPEMAKKANKTRTGVKCLHTFTIQVMAFSFLINQ